MVKLIFTAGPYFHGEEGLHVSKPSLKLVGKNSSSVGSTAGDDGEHAPRGRINILKPAPARPALSSYELDHRVAEELFANQRRLEQIRCLLASDPVVSHRHRDSLASLSYAEQILAQLATIVDKEDWEAAVEQLTNSALKGRLKRTAIRPIGFN